MTSIKVAISLYYVMKIIVYTAVNNKTLWKLNVNYFFKTGKTSLCQQW